MAGGIGGDAGMTISGSGITADRLWMDVIASNLANMETTRTPGGGPYRDEQVVFEAGGVSPGGFAGTLAGALGQGTAGVEVAQIVPSTAPFPETYDPTSPDANAQGYVAMPNVNEVTEMTNLVAASQSYSANATALSMEEQIDQKALAIGQNS
jgi:flagellar basal-body rod protein FlgC